MKVAEPQNGENIEQRAGGLSPGAGELRPRAEKVPRAERVSFRVDLRENVGLREFWVIVEVGCLDAQAGPPGAPSTTGTAPDFSSHTLFSPSKIFHFSMDGNFPWLRINIWIKCEKSECVISGGGGPLLVQGREAIVWSGEHFYLVAFGERGVMVDMSPRKSKHGRPTITL